LVEKRDAPSSYLSDLLLKHCVLGFHVGETELEIMISSLDGSLLSLEGFNLLTLAFSR
jgi:hypothetical protein